MDLEADAFLGPFPFASRPDIDLDEMYAIDIFEAQLAAVYGGDPPTGCSNTPSSELLVKIDLTSSLAKKTKLATIELDFRGRGQDMLASSDDLNTDFFLSNNFDGYKSSSAIQHEIETDEYPSSVRNVVKAASELEAMHLAAGGEFGGGLQLVKDLYGVDIPDFESVRPAVSDSVAARALVPDNKPFHMIFGAENYIPRIKANTLGYQKSNLPPDACLDWARLAIGARLFGLLNLVFDPAVRDHIFTLSLATPRGTITRLANAEFLIPQMTLPRLKAPEAMRVGIIETSKYLESPAFLMKRANDLTAASKTASLVGGEEAAAILAKAKLLRTRITSKRTIVGEFVVGALEDIEMKRRDRSVWIEHARNEAKKGPTTVFVRMLGLSCNQVSIRYRDFKPRVYKLQGMLKATPFSTIKGLEVLKQELRDLASPIPFKEVIKDTITSYMATQPVMMKAADAVIRSLSGFFRTPVSVNSSANELLGAFCSHPPSGIAMLYRACKGELPNWEIQANIAPGKSLQQAVENLHGKLQDILKVRLEIWAQHYENRAAQFVAYNRAKSVSYQVTARAFRTLKLKQILNPHTRFADMSAPHRNYLWLTAKSFLEKRSLVRTLSQPKFFADSKLYAKELDALLQPQISFEYVEEFVFTRLQHVYFDVHRFLHAGQKEISDPYEVSEEAPPVEEKSDEVADFLAFIADSKNLEYDVPIEEQIMASYPDDDGKTLGLVLKMKKCKDVLELSEHFGIAATWSDELAQELFEFRRESPGSSNDVKNIE